MAKRATKKIKETPSDSGMFTSPGRAAPVSGQTGSTASEGMMYAGGTSNFDERTGQPRGNTKGGPTKQAPITPASASESEADLAPPKPLPDTKDSEPAPESAPAPARESEGVTTFTFFKGVELGDANPDFLYKRGDATQVTEAELREYFNAQGSQMLKRSFGDFDNYLAYMTEREGLIQAGDYDVGNWDEYTGSLTEDELMILEGEDLTQYSDTDQDAYTEAYGQQMQEQSSAYDRWVNSEANQALLAKYGVGSTIYNNDGDKYEWNGSAYVKTVKQDQVGLVDYIKMGIVTAMGIMTGGAVSAVAPSLGTVGSSVVSNAITQGITTGSIDPDQLLQTAATAGFSQALNQVIGPALSEAMGGLDISEITGIEEVDNVLNAMGQTAIRQAVFDGELDMEGIVASGLLTGAQEVVEFLFSDLAGQQAISEEQQRELEERFAEYAAIVDEDTMAEVNRVMGNTVNEAIAGQQNEAMRNQLQALAGNLQSIYEEAYDVSPEPSGPSLEDFMASSVDDADSELADTTADLTTDTTVQPEPMESIMYVDDQAIPADRVDEILEGSTVVTTLDGSGDYEYGPMELGDTYLAYHTQHVDESGIEYTLIRGSNGRLYVSDGTNLVEYQGASDLTHNNAQISWLDSHLVSGGGLPTDANNARFLDVTLDVEGAGAESTSDRILANMEAGWQDVNNPDLESLMPQEAPETPLEVEIEVDPFEYEEEPELTPEPPPEPEPEIEPVEQQEQEQAPGEAGTASPSPDPTVQPDPSFTPAPTSAPQPAPQPAPAPAEAPAPAPSPQEEAPITTGMFEEYFPPAPSPASAPASPPASAPPPGAPPAAAPASAPSQAAPPPPAPGTATGTTPESSAPSTTGVGTGSGAGAPAGEAYEQGSLIGDARALIEQALLNGATPEYLQENFPQYSDIITEVSSQLGTAQTQQPITTEDIESIVNQAVNAIPEGMTSEQVSNVVNEAIGNIEFPEGMTASEVSGIVDEAIANIQFPEGLSADDVNNIVENAIFGIDFPDSATMEEVNRAIEESGFATAEAVEAGQAAAAEDRQNLQQAIIAAQGDISQLDESTRQQFEEFGGTVTDLFSNVNVDIEALQTGQISQAEAQQAFQQSTEEQFGELGSQVGELGTQIGGLASDVSGIGQGLEGIGQGIAGIGEGLGAGLLGLAAQQALMPGQIAAATPIQPQKFEKFQRGLTRRKLAEPLRIGMFTGGARSV